MDISSFTSLVDQFDAMSADLSRRHEECIWLRTELATRTNGGSSNGGSYAADGSLANEDGELEMVLQTQKDVNK